MIVKQSSQSSFFSLPDNNIFSLLDEVVRRACTFPYYIAWKVYLPLKENYHWQETISLLFEKGFGSCQRGTGPLLLLPTQEASPLSQHHTSTHLNSHMLGFSRCISDIQGVFKNLKQYFKDFK